MRIFDTDKSQTLVDVVHDLRQPLSTIETSVFMLNSLLRDAPPAAQQQLRIIERQIAVASGILHRASLEVRCANAQDSGTRPLEFTNSHSASVT